MEVIIYEWLKAHPFYSGVIGTGFLALCGLVFAKEKVKLAAFGFSQFIRRTFGRRVEEKIEEIVSAIDDGLESDNEKK